MSMRLDMRTTDPESRVSDTHHMALRLWLRLFTCTQMIERQVRACLRDGYAMTLARFDLMAQLERSPDGLKMNELSRRLMVTGGNVTGLTDQLVAEGLVVRKAIANDRRAYAVRLTPKGRRAFAAMASAHERWIVEIMAGLSSDDRKRLYALLGRLKQAMRSVGDPDARLPDSARKESVR